MALAINGGVPLTISSYAGAETEAVLYAADTEASAISVVVGGLTASGGRTILHPKRRKRKSNCRKPARLKCVRSV